MKGDFGDRRHLVVGDHQPQIFRTVETADATGVMKPDDDVALEIKLEKRMRREQEQPTNAEVPGGDGI
jgi:hypothetical protein